MCQSQTLYLNLVIFMRSYGLLDVYKQPVKALLILIFSIYVLVLSDILVSIPYSRLFLSQKISNKCLNFNFGGYIFKDIIFQICSTVPNLPRHSRDLPAFKTYNLKNLHNQHWLYISAFSYTRYIISSAGCHKCPSSYSQLKVNKLKCFYMCFCVQLCIKASYAV